MLWFLSFREQITKLYAGLFTEATETEGTSTSAQANFGKKWGWYQSIFTIAQEDAAKIDQATKLPVHTCLMYLEYIKDKTTIENALIKKAYKKIDMTQVYDLLDKLKDELRANNHVNTVSFGDITQINLDKTDIFPITHLNISNVVINEGL